MDLMFLKLTRINGSQFWIDPREIAGLEEINGGTEITLKGGATRDVQESIETVTSLIVSFT